MANAASLAMYDGEDVEHVACLINGRLAVGTFEWVEDIKVDDEVKLVASEIENGPLFVHAILRKRDQLLWMPYQRASGRRELTWDMVRLCAAGLVGMWILAFAIFFLSDRFPDRADYPLHVLISVSLVAFVGFMALRDSLPDGKLAEEIFSVLSVRNPKRFRLMPYSLMMLDKSGGYDPIRNKQGFVFDFAAALAAHNKRFGIA